MTLIEVMKILHNTIYNSYFFNTDMQTFFLLLLFTCYYFKCMYLLSS